MAPPAAASSAEEARGALPRRQSPFSVRWRVDKDESGYHHARLRSNVVELCTAPDAGKLRRLVVDLHAPALDDAVATTTEGPCDEEEGGVPSQRLNSDQQRALDATLAARDYSLILGMPGTGKTFVICRVIQALVAQGKSVLVTSFTNSAVDNILKRLASLDVDFLRLGQHGSIDKELTPYTLATDDAREMATAAATARVVACTCHGVNHSLFTGMGAPAARPQPEPHPALPGLGGRAGTRGGAWQMCMSSPVCLTRASYAKTARPSWFTLEDTLHALAGGCPYQGMEGALKCMTLGIRHRQRSRRHRR